jgi:hypothetical protein
LRPPALSAQIRLIDTELPLLDQRIPNDFNHLHYGAGQTEAEITLKPGTHTLQLLFGDKITSAHSPAHVSTDSSRSSRSRNRENNRAAEQKAHQKKDQMRPPLGLRFFSPTPTR